MKEPIATTRKSVDLSIFLENDVVSDSPAFAPKIEYFTHENSFEQIAPFFPGLRKEDLPDGEGWAVETVQLSTHNGTHLDSPYHFHSTTNSLKANPNWLAFFAYTRPFYDCQASPDMGYVRGVNS